jgi:phospholipid transport system substrate-binding protein
MTPRPLSAGVLMLAFMLLAPASATKALQDPNAFIAGLGTHGMQVLGPQVPLAQRIERFRELFQANFDVLGIGQFVLGRYWRSLTPAQQQEYLSLFQEYTVRAYSARLGEYTGAPFRVMGSRPSGREIVVSSEVLPAGGRAVHLDWYLTERGGQYKVSDVHVDGISMRVTQRDYFQSIIQNNGGRPDALLSVLRQEIRRSR